MHEATGDALKSSKMHTHTYLESNGQASLDEGVAAICAGVEGDALHTRRQSAIKLQIHGYAMPDKGAEYEKIEETPHIMSSVKNAHGMLGQPLPKSYYFRTLCAQPHQPPDP